MAVFLTLAYSRFSVSFFSSLHRCTAWPFCFLRAASSLLTNIVCKTTQQKYHQRSETIGGQREKEKADLRFKMGNTCSSGGTKKQRLEQSELVRAWFIIFSHLKLSPPVGQDWRGIKGIAIISSSAGRVTRRRELFHYFFIMAIGDSPPGQNQNIDQVEGEGRRPIAWEEVERENQLANLK